MSGGWYHFVMTRRRPTQAQATIPKGLRSAPLVVGSRAFVVLSYPIEGTARVNVNAHAEDDPRSTLTTAERDVGQAVIRGMSSAEIAAARSRSVSTINKQIESLYRKLGVHSRSELCARYETLAISQPARQRT
jgi:DNA-binding NarL/FixJ family response regulator